MSQRDARGKFVKAEVRPFKVGDEVIGESWCFAGKWLGGKFLGYDEDGDGKIEDLEDIGYPRRVKPGSMRLLEPAPQPKADDAKDAEIERLKAEVDESGREIAILESRLEDWHTRAEAAEAKLADIAAINRVAEMVNAIPDDAEPWHFQGLVQRVLDGAA